jgi:hypothetical protein
MEPARNPNPSFPLFPNNVNPSNSVAIGGVFDITTPAISNHVELIKSKIKEQILADETAVTNAQLAAVQPATKFDISEDEVRRNFGQPSAPTIEPIELMPIVPKTSPPLPLPSGDGGPPPGDGDDDDDGDGGPPPSGDAAANAAQKAINDAAAANAAQKAINDAAAKQKVIDDAKALAAAKAKADAAAAAAATTKYIFAFDMDDTLFKDRTLDKLSTDANDVQYRNEIIANMKRVINSRNYVWIVTANNKYTKDDFTTKFFGLLDKDFFDKSHYFLFMNPDIMKNEYTRAKNDDSLLASDKAKLDYNDGWDGYSDIHQKGLKPYAIYAQSLLTRSEYNKKYNPKIGEFNTYLFDDKSKDKIVNNSKKFHINFIRVTDFDTTPNLNLLNEFKKVLDDGKSKIGSAKPLVIPDEYTDINIINSFMADNTDLPKCEADKYVNKPDFINPPPPLKNNMIGKNSGGKSSNNLQICVNGIVATNDTNTDFSTDTDITKWTTSSDNIYSDHAPVKYIYVITDNTIDVICNGSNTTNNEYDSTNTSFITWNIAYKMIHTGRFYLSKFYCSDAANPEICTEKDTIYEKRMQNILTAIRSIMENDYNKNTNYVFLQECTKILLDVVAKVPGFNDSFEILHKGLDKGESEFCLVVRKSAVPPTLTPPESDIVIFDFDQNKDGSPAMSKYISDQFYSYDIEVNTPDLKRVMCYIVKSTTTIFFNVHFAFGKSFIFKRQSELYNFMNAIVYSIRSIPSSNKELYEYQNYDIVFTGDFNVNMLQRFPQDIKRFGYPDGNMIPIFFTCNYIKEQKTIISTTYNNLATARATNDDTENYNLTNIDFSIFYPRIGDAGTTPIAVEPQTPMPKKQTLPVGPGSPGKSTPTPLPPKVVSGEPPYITKSNELLSADPSVPNCACGHMICKRFQILKNQNMVRLPGGLHSVMIFESANDKTPTSKNFRILLGKELKTEKKKSDKSDKYTFYCMNTIGGTADHKSLDKNCEICIIKNLIDEINEEAKLKFPNGDPSIVATSCKGNMNEEVFNKIFKKSGATGTDYTDYYLYARGGYVDLTNSKFKTYDFSFVFYGLYPYIFKESDLCKLITDTNEYIKTALTTSSIGSSLKEIKYLNLLDYHYDVLSDNPNYRTEIIFDNPSKYKFVAPENKYYLIPPSEFRKDKVYVNFFNSGTDEKNNLFNFKDTDYISFFARGSIYTSEKPFFNAQKIIDEVVANAKSITPTRPVLNYDSDSYSFGKATAYPYCDLIISSMAGGNHNTNKRHTLKNNKPTSRKIKKSTSASMPTTRFTKKQHSHNKKHKTRRHKH